MSCDLALGANRIKPCTNSQGGTAEFYPFNYVENAFTVVGGVATALDGLLGETVYRYEIEGDNNPFEQNTIADHKTGTKVNTQTLACQLFKIDAATNVELDKLASGKISGVVKDRNGKYHWFAKDSVNITSTVQSLTGGAKTDVNGYNITLVADTLEKAPILDDTTRDAFLALVAV